MDTDEARQISEEIHRRIYREERGRRGSDGDQPRSQEPLVPGIRAPGTDVRRDRPGDPSAGQGVTDNRRGDSAVGGVTLLNIPLPTIADEPLPEHPSLNRPAMSDLTVDIE